MESILEVRGLRKVFNGAAALDGVSFTLKRGEIVGLLGPNGAGKTTLIHTLLGLLEPSAGTMRAFGLDFPKHRQQVLQRVNFSSAYTQMPLSLTPRQNLFVFAKLYGVADAAGQVERLLKRMELWDQRDKPTRGMSSGQVSRMNLAKSLLNDPEILFLDEPTASMDPDIADKTRRILREIQRERSITVLVTSHNMKEIAELADRVLFLNKGAVVAEGTAKELTDLFQLPDLEAVFLKIARQS